MLFAAALVTGTAPGGHAAVDDHHGCVPDRPALAHHPGGPPLVPQPAGAPIPCGVLTGFAGAETRIVVDRAGAGFFDPAIADPGPTSCVVRCARAGLAISTAEGATLSFSECPAGSRVDNSLDADPDTNRVFWIPFSDATPTLDVRTSDDDGKTWQSSSACCGSAENPRVVTAMPRTSHSTGYPKLVYLCSNTSYIGGLVSTVGARVCSKSLDGGRTFALVGPLFSKPAPQHAECRPSGEVFGAVDNHYPQAAPDGSLYVLVRCGGNAPSSTDREYLAKSVDEAATWPIVHPVPLPRASANDLDKLRVDTAGNLYLIRTDSTTYRPILRTSTDGGATWGPEMDMAAPGVDVGHPASEAPGVFISPQLWEVAVRGPGRVAVGYYARPNGKARWDAYLTETWNALDRQPLLWSARLNPDAVDLTDALTDTIGNDFMGTTIGPNDTAWASFYHSTGFAGRLEPAAAATSPTTRGSPGPNLHQRLPATGDSGSRAFAALAALATAYCLRKQFAARQPVRLTRM